MADFYKSIDFVLSHEGGYLNDPNDPGGETNFGISKRYHPNIDIKNLTRNDAIEIYNKEYWTPSGAGTVEDDTLSLMHFDASVNIGIIPALHFLKDSNSNKNLYTILRIQYYIDQCKKYPTKKKYFFGWVNRAMEAQNG